jgi:hypothetical protein
MAQGSTKGVPIDVDVNLAANSDEMVASQKATKAYVDNTVTEINTKVTQSNVRRIIRR